MVNLHSPADKPSKTREGGRNVTIISISDTAKQKVHTAALVTAQILLGVALGCAMWFGLKDRLTFTIQTVEPVSVAASRALLLSSSTAACWKEAATSAGTISSPRCFAVCTALISAVLRPEKL